MALPRIRGGKDSKEKSFLGIRIAAFRSLVNRNFKTKQRIKPGGNKKAEPG
jgi:hypothetical protein